MKKLLPYLKPYWFVALVSPLMMIGEVLGVMREVAQDGMTMLVVTHEMEFARHVSSQVVFMEQGQIVESGSSQGFFEAPRTERARAFVRSILGQHRVEE